MVGGWLISSLIDKLLFTPVKKPVVVPIRPKAVVQQAQEEIKPIPKPWESLVDPRKFMNNCYEGIKQINSTILPGWNIGVITCKGSTAATTWTKGVGFMYLAEKAINNSGLDVAAYSFDASGRALSASFNLPPLDTVESPPSYNMVNLRNTINNEFQVMNLPINLGEVSEQVSSEQSKERFETFHKLKFSFSSPHNPEVWINLLIKYSGLEINLITYTPGGVWNYEGAIYVL